MNNYLKPVVVIILSLLMFGCNDDNNSHANELKKSADQRSIENDPVYQLLEQSQASMQKDINALEKRLNELAASKSKH